MKQTPQAAARRYARALLDVALKHGEPAGLRAELQALSDTIAQHRELSAALSHPGLGGERRTKLVKAVFGAAASDLANRLLALLAERDRLALLPAIAESFAQLVNEQRGVVSAEAVGAVSLDAGQREALVAALRRVTGHEVELKLAVDPSVLGGIVVTMGGRTYDGTVRTQLKNLRGRLSLGVSG